MYNIYFKLKTNFYLHKYKSITNTIISFEDSDIIYDAYFNELYETLVSTKY